jgi:hypothetical protein
MSISHILKSQTTQWLLSGALLIGLSVFVFWLVGWIGIGTIGVFGLFISTTVALNSGSASVGDYINSSGAALYTRGVEVQRSSQISPEQKMAAEAERGKRSRTLYLINSIFIAMAALGFWMFVQHDL